MSIFRTPPAPPQRVPEAQAVRDYYIAKIEALFADPDQRLDAIAETIMMDNLKLRGYYELLRLGTIHHWTAANLIESTENQHIPECVRQLTAASA